MALALRKVVALTVLETLVRLRGKLAVNVAAMVVWMTVSVFVNAVVPVAVRAPALSYAKVRPTSAEFLKLMATPLASLEKVAIWRVAVFAVPDSVQVTVRLIVRTL